MNQDETKPFPKIFLEYLREGIALSIEKLIQEGWEEYIANNPFKVEVKLIKEKKDEV